MSELKTCLNGYDLPPHDAPCKHCGATVDEECRIAITGDLLADIRGNEKDDEIEKMREWHLSRLESYLHHIEHTTPHMAAAKILADIAALRDDEGC